MAKKTIEIEVNYPDCTICGNEISGGEKYFSLGINLVKHTLDKTGGSCGIQTGNSQRPLIICKNCSPSLTPYALGEDPMNFSRKTINIIMKEVEMQMNELLRMK